MIMPSVLAAPVDYAVSTASVKLTKAEDGGKGSFTITVPMAEKPYSSLQFELYIPVSVELVSVTYVPSIGARPPQIQPGSAQDPNRVYNDYFFVMYSTTNVFNTQVVCTVNVSYTGSEKQTISIVEIKQVTAGMKDTFKSNSVKTVELVPYASVDSPGGGTGTPGDGSGTPGDGAGSPGAGGNQNPGEDIGDGDLPLVGMEKPVAELDMSNLNAYLLGDPQGTVRPNENISRAEVASLLFGLITNEDKEEYISGASGFSDVGTDKWYSKAVGFLVEAGIVTGYTDGTFKGGNNITRAECAAILTRFGELNLRSNLPFSDVEPSNWAYENILTAYNNLWIKGYPDGTFGPNLSIKRAEAVAMINRMIKRDLPDYNGYPMKFSDVPDVWYYGDILAASSDRQQDVIP